MTKGAETITVEFKIIGKGEVEVMNGHDLQIPPPIKDIRGPITGLVIKQSPYRL